ncbi:MAG: UDP-glucose 4-epimerase GalE [Alphaproteobacteria bacterium GM7ARS4]|nr:UDP-glucose 4-epimerase GalE [Alphaproteobacteria bacterium GM7ARS4]
MAKGKHLVTGGAGYVGSHIVLALRDEGRDVIVVDNLSTGHRHGLPRDIPLLEGDIRDEVFLDSVFASHKIESVIHAAAVASVPESVADPQRCHDINVEGTRRVIEMVCRHGVPFIVFSSTSTVYDEGASVPFSEETPLGPISPYAVSKVDGEALLRASCAGSDVSLAGMEHAGGASFAYVVLRYFNVGGADPSMRAGDRKRSATTLIKSALECAIGMRSHVALFGTDYETEDGTAVRDYVHVWDVARAHLLVLSYLEKGGRSDIMNIGVGRGFSVRDVIASVRRVSGKEFVVVEEGRRAGDPPCIFGDVSRARDVIGFEARYTTLDSIVRDGWRWETRMRASRGVTA